MNSIKYSCTLLTFDNAVQTLIWLSKFIYFDSFIHKYTYSHTYFNPPHVDIQSHESPREIHYPDITSFTL